MFRSIVSCLAGVGLSVPRLLKLAFKVGFIVLRYLVRTKGLPGMLICMFCTSGCIMPNDNSPANGLMWSAKILSSGSVQQVIDTPLTSQNTSEPQTSYPSSIPLESVNTNQQFTVDE